MRLIILGCAFLIIVPISAARLGLSPSPVTTHQEQTKERPNPPSVRITSSTSLIYFCPPATRSLDSCSANREVELSAIADGPAADAKLLYVWTVQAGRIRGEGQKVIWDLSGVADGTYTANVEVNNGSGLRANDSTKVTIALCPDCITIESPCPTIMVACPETAKSNQTMTFEAHAYGGYSTVKMTYTWSVNAGKISGGQGTSMVTIDVSDVTRESVTATVSIGGLDPACVNTASCTTRTSSGAAKVGAGEAVVLKNQRRHK